MIDFQMPKHGKNQQLNIADLTNFLDVLLILVIFFIVSTTLNHPLLPLKLPETESAVIDQSKYRRETLYLSIQEKNSYRLQNKNYNYLSLRIKLKDLFTENPSRKIILYADQDVSFGDFIRLVDLFKTIGFEEVNIASEPLKKEVNLMQRGIFSS